MIGASSSLNKVNLKERKWLVLVFIGALVLAPYFIFLFSSHRALEKRLEAVRAAGLPVSPAELDAWYLPATTSSNRALAIVEAEKAYVAPTKGADPRRKLFGSGAPGSLTPHELASVKTILDNNQAALSLLHDCVDLPETRYPIDLSAGPNTLLPYLAQVKALVELLLLEAIFESQQTNITGSVRSLTTAFSVADSLREEPFLISAYVRLESVRQTIDALSRLLSEHQLTAKQLDSLGHSLAVAEEAGKRNLFRALVGERASAVTVFEMSLPELERIGLPGAPNGDSSLPMVAFEFYQLSGIRERDFAAFLDSMEQLISAAELAFPASLRAFERAETDLSRRLGGRFTVMSRNLVLQLVIAGLKEANSIAMLRCALAAVAIEKFRLAHDGSLPTDLNEVAPNYIYKLPADPYDGTSLQFQRDSDKGYRVFASGAAAANQNYRSPMAMNLTFDVHR